MSEKGKNNKTVTKKTVKKEIKKEISEEEVDSKDKNIIDKESYMLYFTLTYIVIRLICNGLNLFPIITELDDSTACVLTNFLMIVGTVAAMALNFMIHKKHRVNKHQFNYIKKFIFGMFCVVTLLVNIYWIIGYIKFNILITVILLIIHVFVIYIYTKLLFNKYVEK